MDTFPLEDIVEKVGSRFAVVVAAAQRAKQIKDGSPPLVSIGSRNPLTIALAEIAEGKVTILPPEEPEEEAATSTIDAYFAGRDKVVEDVIPFRRPRREAKAVRDDSDDDVDEEEEDDDELEDDDETVDDDDE